MSTYIDVSNLPEKLNLDDEKDSAIMADEAVARMEKLSMLYEAIQAFKRGDVWMSETDLGALYEIDDDNYAKEILDAIREKGMLPYHIIHNMTEIGELYSVLYVSRYPMEWETDRLDLSDGIVYADVYNKNGGFDDLGTITIKPRNGGLIRTA